MWLGACRLAPIVKRQEDSSTRFSNSHPRFSLFLSRPSNALFFPSMSSSISALTEPFPPISFGLGWQQGRVMLGSSGISSSLSSGGTWATSEKSGRSSESWVCCWGSLLCWRRIMRSKKLIFELQLRYNCGWVTHQLIMFDKKILFSAYSMVYVLYGALSTALGPIIIFYSEVTGHDETYFSFIFLAKALGYLIGGTLVKRLVQHYSYHQIYIGLMLACGVTLMLSSLSFGFWNQSINICIAGACVCMITVLTNLCIFILFAVNDKDYWVQLVNLFFGVGGLIGPLIVIWYEQYALLVIGIIFLAASIPFFFLKSPEERDSHIQRKAEQQETKLSLGRFPEVCICLLFFFYIAEEVGYASWAPTYALKAGVADPHGASFTAALFWISNTIARLALIYMPGTVTSRLRILLRLLLVSTLLMAIFQSMDMLTLVAYAGVTSSGIFLSAMYALFMTLAQEYGYELTPNNTANFAMCASIGQGLLVMPIGYAMGIFGYRSLIVIIFLMSLVMYIIFEVGRKRLEVEAEEQRRQQLEGTNQLSVPLKDMSTPTPADNF